MGISTEELTTEREPRRRLGEAAQRVCPRAERVGVELVQLVEVAEGDAAQPARREAEPEVLSPQGRAPVARVHTPQRGRPRGALLLAGRPLAGRPRVGEAGGVGRVRIAARVRRHKVGEGEVGHPLGKLGRRERRRRRRGVEQRIVHLRQRRRAGVPIVRGLHRRGAVVREGVPRPRGVADEVDEDVQPQAVDRARRLRVGEAGEVEESVRRRGDRAPPSTSFRMF